MYESKNIFQSKVLIVDDVPQNVQLIGSLIIPYGFNIAIAQDGEKAIEIAEKFLPDIILMDINIPKIDGIAATKILSESPITNGIPIILITAMDSSNDVIRGFEAGAVDYIKKPFDTAELMKRITIHLDIKITKDKIISQNKKLIELNATKDKFFNLVSHDLRGPFSGTLGITELVLENTEAFDKNELIEIISKIHVSMKQQLQQFENLIDWAKVKTGLSELHPEKVMLGTLIDDCIKNLLINAKNKNLHILIDIEAGIELECDIFMISSVIRNLLSNAIKFTPNGGKITLKAYLDSPNIVFIIEDTGVGIEEDRINNLFDIVHHNSSEGTESEKGSGIGLILCKEFINLHKGSIDLKSKVTEGTIFKISIPKNYD